MCIVINLSHQSTKMVADVAEVTSWIRMKIWDVTLDKGLRDYHLLSCMIHGGFSSETVMNDLEELAMPTWTWSLSVPSRHRLRLRFFRKIFT